MSFKIPEWGAATRVIPSVRCGVLGYVERARRIPVKVNGVMISLRLSITQQKSITMLSESVYDSMSPCPKVLSNVDVNLAGGGSNMSVDSLGPVQLGIDGDEIEH